MGRRAFWNFRRQGKVKLFMPPFVEDGYFLKSPNCDNCQKKSLKNFVMCLVEKVSTDSTFDVIHIAG